MRSNLMLKLKANMNSLNLTLPTDVEKYEKIVEKISTLPKHEGKKNLNGVTNADDVAAEVERRALDAVLANERANQARLMTDAANRAIDGTLIRETETIIEALRPIVLKAHKTIMTSHEKMNGSITADTAIELDKSKDYKAANDAWTVIDTAATIRSTLNTLDRPDFDRSNERTYTFWRFQSLTALKVYHALPDVGTPAGNHALSASTEGVELVWLSTDEAEAQAHALAKAQTAEDNGDQSGMVWDADAMVYRVGADSWKYL